MELSVKEGHEQLTLVSSTTAPILIKLECLDNALRAFTPNEYFNFF